MTSFLQFGRIGDIPESQWQSLRQDRYPFMDYHFLKALEDNHCIGSSTGWTPVYLARCDDNGSIDLLIPLYLKEHSYGEYVFDWSWADAYHRHGFQYYPKLLWAIPFTPASGPRLLCRGDAQQAWQDAIGVVRQLAANEDVSGWHLNFFLPDVLPALASADLLVRSACQYHWFNRGYQHFDHYLEHFTSRKRKAVRKERSRIQDSGIELQRLSGAGITAADIQFFYRCYQSTYHKRGQQGYLTSGFFHQLLQHMSDQMLLVIATHQQQRIAAALYFFDDHTLYGRYWGCLQEVDGLHFEACYYQGIEFCIKRGLQRFDPGTQGEHKISRGFEPILTYSAHELAHPGFQDAVARFIGEEQQQILAWQQEAATLLPFSERALETPSPVTNTP